MIVFTRLHLFTWGLLLNDVISFSFDIPVKVLWYQWRPGSRSNSILYVLQDEVPFCRTYMWKRLKSWSSVFLGSVVFTSRTTSFLVLMSTFKDAVEFNAALNIHEMTRWGRGWGRMHNGVDTEMPRRAVRGFKGEALPPDPSSKTQDMLKTTQPKPL